MGGSSSLLGEEVLLEFSHEGLLFGSSLEATMSELGRGVDPLEVDLLEGDTLGVGAERLPEGDRALLHSKASSTEHDEVLSHDTVVSEATLQTNT